MYLLLKLLLCLIGCQYLGYYRLEVFLNAVTIPTMSSESEYKSPFYSIALQYREQVGVILKEGKTSRPLRNGSEFKTTPRHTVVVATICNELGSLIGLDQKTQNKLNITAVLHDADKRLEHRPKEFNGLEKLRLNWKMNGLHLDKDLLQATKEKFVERNQNNMDNLSLPQMILYYSDMIVSWDRIMKFDDRIAESIQRRPDLPEDFFAMEIKFGHEIERKIFNQLPTEVQKQIESPEMIPQFLIDRFQQATTPSKL